MDNHFCRREKWAVVTDFDATITTRDIGDSIIGHFNAASAKEIRDSCRPGVAVEKWMEEVFERAGIAGAGPKEIRKFVLDTAVMRRGFGEFLRLCRKRKIPVEIVSGGLDIYVKPLFKKWGIKTRSFFGSSSRVNGRMKISYPFLRNMNLEEFKASRVRAFQDRGYRVVFLGDGTSDYLAACLADAVFARRKLYPLCRENGVPVHRLVDFHSVMRTLEHSQPQADPPSVWRRRKSLVAGD